MRAAIGLLVLAAWIAALSGCNTMKGFGKDMETAGEAIQRKSTR